MRMGELYLLPIVIIIIIIITMVLVWRDEAADAGDVCIDSWRPHTDSVVKTETWSDRNWTRSRVHCGLSTTPSYNVNSR